MKQLTNLFAVAGLAVICTACPGKPHDVVPNPGNANDVAGNGNNTSELDQVQDANDKQTVEIINKDPAKPTPAKPADTTTPAAPATPATHAISLDDARKAFDSFVLTSAYRWTKSEQCGAADDKGTSGTSNWYSSGKKATWSDGTYELIACVHDGVVFSGDLYGKRTVAGTTVLTGTLQVSGAVTGECDVTLAAPVTKTWKGEFCGFTVAELTATQPEEGMVPPNQSGQE